MPGSDTLSDGELSEEELPLLEGLGLELAPGLPSDGGVVVLHAESDSVAMSIKHRNNAVIFFI